ncbi:MAG: heavy-metal-associated domain-containing protein [Bacteroidetes bacterium]|nr:MAG: heavy-metal-associated domain-containing protein [Bacteroidota bacterium]
MTKVKFKTNIKCMGCVNTVTPFLNQAAGIQHWEVDLQDPNRVLTVDLEDGSQPMVVKEALKEAGYTAEELA